SFNVPGGRCEACQGDGFQKLEMYFFEDIYVTCEACEGRRYGPEVLRVAHRGRNISQVLQLTVDDALGLFATHSGIERRLRALQEVGLGYLRLGQPATTLSGGEAQRLKIAAELGARLATDFLYLLDEPTTGLHLDDVRKLLAVLQRLVEAGNTVVVVEHHLDVIKSADWVVDLGPEGGEAGGEIVAEGPPAGLAAAAAGALYPAAEGGAGAPAGIVALLAVGLAAGLVHRWAARGGGVRLTHSAVLAALTYALTAASFLPLGPRGWRLFARQWWELLLADAVGIWLAARLFVDVVERERREAAG